MRISDWSSDVCSSDLVLKRTLLLIDARHGIKDVDRDIMKMLDEAAVSYRIAITKADKVKASDLAETCDKVTAEIRKRHAAHPVIIVTSSAKGMGIAELRAAVLDALALEKAPLTNHPIPATGYMTADRNDRNEALHRT